MIVEWYRKGRLSIEESEIQYDIIAKDRQEIESKLRQIEFNASLNEVMEGQYLEEGQILKEHYELVTVANDDIHVRYMLIQKFVRRVTIETQGSGYHKDFMATAEFVLGGSRYLATPGSLVPVNDSNMVRDV
jgi:hypothetical protein